MKPKIRCGLMTPGLLDYEQGLALQDKARALIDSNDWDGVLILLEHFPVITVGTSGVEAHLSPTGTGDDKTAGAPVIQVSRGGSVTCHNPGQLVAYPILNLNRWHTDVHWYVRTLEDVLIRTLAHYRLVAGRKARYTGVWLQDEKVAAIGVSVRRWITGHGFALNVNNDLRLFERIVPCGIREFGVTSLARQGLEASLADVADVVAGQFSACFDCELSPT